jgi:hypothetical protein
MGSIPTKESVVKRWLSDLSNNIAAFGPAAGLLATQIDYLERRCVAMHHRIVAKEIKPGTHHTARPHHATIIGASSATRRSRQSTFRLEPEKVTRRPRAAFSDGRCPNSQ